ncbi:MAG: methyl-accepting chemotaxis protein McpB [Enterovirga sp.]|nr:methyl-accepting chemotaxis protein McpB [Enterovirga sp.]
MPLHDQFELRRAHYGIDAATQASLKQVWPLLAAELDAALAGNLRAASQLPPPVGPLMRSRGEEISRLSRAHLEEVFLGSFDALWVGTCEAVSAAELELGLDARHRAGVNRFVLEAAARAIGRRHRFNGAAVARLLDAVGRTLLLDVACAVIYHSHQLTRRAEARAAGLDQAIAAFSESATDVRSSMNELAVSLTSTSGRLTSLAEHARREVATARQATAGASANADATASSTQEMSASIDEIDEHVRRSVDLATSASLQAERSHAGIKTLLGAVEKIGSVVGLIAEIAAQTNLLSLNATIEAARAGEAGRGFSVVAAEVKSLAGQTANATDEIGRQIELIHEATRRSVAEISAIREAVFDMQGSAATIAAAIHQQNDATNRIAEGAQSSADHVQTATAAVTVVEDAIGRTSDTVSAVLQTSRVIAERTQQLDVAMSLLSERVRAA